MKKMFSKLNAIIGVLVLSCSLLLTGCNQATTNPETPTATPQSKITKTLIKLNTVVTIDIYDKQEQSLLDGAMELCDYYETIFSRTKPESELYRFNHGLLNTATDGTNHAKLSDDLAMLIEEGYQYGNLSKGKFDITIAPLAELWNFSADNPKVPDDKVIQSLLGEIDYKKITVDGKDVTLADESMAIDLGAIAKGYIADRIKDYLVANGVKSATINLGGNVLCIGTKPDGKPFNIGIQKPFEGRNELVGAVEIDDMTVVSSGIYERCFKENGNFYHHILNPATGYPYNNDLISVTIVTKRSVDGDGLSTSCFALGLEEGMELINSMEETYALFITSDYEFHYSEGFLEDLHFTPITQ